MQAQQVHHSFDISVAPDFGESERFGIVHLGQVQWAQGAQGSQEHR